MGLNDTPSGERVHIGFFGRRNVGKSSLVNAVTGQDLSVVSPTKGTTTDPVRKSMEILPVGPVVIIDTPGMDDSGELGTLRVEKTRNILETADIAVLVTDAREGLTAQDRDLMALFGEKKVPFVLVYNKSDLLPKKARALPGAAGHEIFASARTGDHIDELKEMIARVYGEAQKDVREVPLVSDLVQGKGPVVLVIPIDESAPKGRLILPQQQVIRDLLDAGIASVCTREFELADTLEALKEPPAMVITDSQAFRVVSQIVPETVPLTSFSILMARHKGFLRAAVRGADAIDDLKESDTILISEGCTHHRQCGDIGTVKLPRLLSRYTGKTFRIETSSGKGFPEDLSSYSLVIHCGACMLREKEVSARIRRAETAGVPVTNYGTAIAKMNGILERSLSVFSDRSDLMRKSD